ncbi:AF-4 proto-oncoprotein domain-containing protein [Phthorimaea operculella]|nr:AF-4 proto-oncoprotein domain-containing protein [Phthorimaea operculella]
MHMCYERPGLVTTLNGTSGYDKWERAGGGGGGGGSGGGPGGSWAGRDRERDRERERQARAHQMSQAHAAEPDASSLFPAPFRVTGNSDRVSQQIRAKLGDYNAAQTLLDDPSKSIGICAEPPSPAPCPPSRRESEFKKPAHAPQNGRVHHRPFMYNKSDAPCTTGAAPHRPPNLRIPNGFQNQNAIDSSQPPIERDEVSANPVVCDSRDSSQGAREQVHLQPLHQVSGARNPSIQQRSQNTSPP